MASASGGGYSVFNWVISFIDATSLLLPLYVIYLIIYASPASMRPYRPYLALISLWDFMFTAALTMLLPEILYPASSIVAHGPVGLAGRNAILSAYSLAMFAAINGLWTQDLCLLYRFLVVQSNQKLKNVFLDWKSVIVFQLAISAASFWCSLLNWQTYYNPENNRRVLDYYEEHVDGIAPYNRNATVMCSGTHAGFANYTIGHDFDEVLVLQTQTRKMNVQLTWLLVAQFAAPLAFLMGPILVMLVGSYTHLEPSQNYNVMYILAVSLYGYANATLTLIFVAPYRNRTKQNLLWLASKTRLRREVETSSNGASRSTTSSVSLSVRPSIAVVPMQTRRQTLHM